MPAVISEESWIALLSAHLHIDAGPLSRRAEIRYNISPSSGVRCTKICSLDGRALAQYASVIQVSQRGCMLRSDREMPEGSLVYIEISFGDRSFMVQGKVAHSTSTVGAYKTGIELFTDQPVDE